MAWVCLGEDIWHLQRGIYPKTKTHRFAGNSQSSISLHSSLVSMASVWLGEADVCVYSSGFPRDLEGAEHVIEKPIAPTIHKPFFCHTLPPPKSTDSTASNTQQKRTRPFFGV